MRLEPYVTITAPTSTREQSWTIRRYCFKEKKTTTFEYCDNCGHYFCTDHAEWIDDDWNGRIVNFPTHAACS